MLPYLNFHTYYKVLALSIMFIFGLIPKVFSHAIQFPKGGEHLYIGQNYAIAWDPKSVDGEMVDITLWDGRKSKWIDVATNVSNSTGIYIWEIPASFEGDRFRIRINCKSQNNITMSSAYFSIQKKPLLNSSQKIEKTDSLLIQIMPNPAKDYVEIFWPGAAIKILIRDELGKLVVVEMANSTQSFKTLGTQNLPSGIYTVSIVLSDGKIISKRFIIKK